MCIRDRVNEDHDKDKGTIISILTADWWNENGRLMTTSCMIADKYVERLNALGYELDCYDSYHFVVWKSSDDKNCVSFPDLKQTQQ